MIESGPVSAHDDRGTSKLEEIDHILADLERLRHSVVEAWQGRAIFLRKAERQRLRDAIRSTCELLTALTEND